MDIRKREETIKELNKLSNHMIERYKCSKTSIKTGEFTFKRMYYRDNILSEEIHYTYITKTDTNNLYLHRDGDLPAYIKYNKDGSIRIKEYWISDYLLNSIEVEELENRVLRTKREQILEKLEHEKKSF